MQERNAQQNGRSTEGYTRVLYYYNIHIRSPFSCCRNLRNPITRCDKSSGCILAYMQDAPKDSINNLRAINAHSCNRLLSWDFCDLFSFVTCDFFYAKFFVLHPFLFPFELYRFFFVLAKHESVLSPLLRFAFIILFFTLRINCAIFHASHNLGCIPFSDPDLRFDALKGCFDIREGKYCTAHTINLTGSYLVKVIKRDVSIVIKMHMKNGDWKKTRQRSLSV